MHALLSGGAECERLTRFCIAYDYSNAEAVRERAVSERKQLEDELAESTASARECGDVAARADADIAALAQRQREESEGELRTLVESREALAKEVVQREAAVANKRSSLAEEAKNRDALLRQRESLCVARRCDSHPCVYVWMHACVCACVHACVRVCTRACMCASAWFEARVPMLCLRLPQRGRCVALILSVSVSCRVVLAVAGDELDAAARSMSSRLVVQQSQTQEVQLSLTQDNARLEELIIRQQAVNAGMTQSDGGQVTTLAEQHMQELRAVQQFETGAAVERGVTASTQAHTHTFLIPFAFPCTKLLGRKRTCALNDALPSVRSCTSPHIARVLRSDVTCCAVCALLRCRRERVRPPREGRSRPDQERDAGPEGCGEGGQGAARRARRGCAGA